MAVFVYALMAHGVIGGLDVILNHELIVRLPRQPTAGPEQRLHTAREFLFAAIFFSLAWHGWHGQWVWWIAALFLAECGVSLRDMVVEGDTRVLPVPERVLHVFLFTNLGVVMALLAMALIEWHALPTSVVRVDYGWASWVMSGMGLGSLAWALRDGLNVLRRIQGKTYA
jgi:hypothetical protein